MAGLEVLEVGVVAVRVCWTRKRKMRSSCSSSSSSSSSSSCSCCCGCSCSCSCCCCGCGWSGGSDTKHNRANTGRNHKEQSALLPSAMRQLTERALGSWRLWRSTWLSGESGAQDVAYVYSGYAPISIRLVERALSPP
eukprot:2363678-Rhodomonas_salina.1